MNSDVQGSHVCFDPIGLWVKPGTTVRWTIAANVHTVTAYHPDNDDHSLRIPEGAASFHSDYLINPGDKFELTLTVPGTYDCYCAPHELGGMVGRIIVGEPGGPGSKPFDYFAKSNRQPEWETVPEVAQNNFPAENLIMQQHVIRVGDMC